MLLFPTLTSVLSPKELARPAPLTVEFFTPAASVAHPHPQSNVNNRTRTHTQAGQSETAGRRTILNSAGVVHRRRPAPSDISHAPTGPSSPRPVHGRVHPLATHTHTCMHAVGRRHFGRSRIRAAENGAGGGGRFLGAAGSWIFGVNEQCYFRFV